MPKQRHIGFVIFGVCSALSARIAMFEPRPHVPTASEERWGAKGVDTSDSLGLIHSVRYYIYGLGVVGPLIVAEDYVAEHLRRRKGGSPPPLPKSGALASSQQPPPLEKDRTENRDPGKPQDSTIR